MKSFKVTNKEKEEKELEKQKKAYKSNKNNENLNNFQKNKGGWFNLVNLFVGLTLGTLLIVLVEEVDIYSYLLMGKVLIPPFIIFAVMYGWGLLRKKYKNKWTLIFIFCITFILLFIVSMTVTAYSQNKKYNPNNFAHIPLNQNEESLTKEQMIDKVNNMSDEELRNMAISEVNNVSTEDLKQVMINKIDNLILPNSMKDELRNEYISMSDEEIKEQFIQEMENVSLDDYRKQVLNKINSLE